MEKLIISFWHKVPKSWLYWAVIVVWAKAMSEKYGDKHPDEITWNMILEFLNKEEGGL